MTTRTVILFFLIVCWTKPFAQAVPFARIEVSRSSVYVQESFRVTITVMTPSWFTAPPEFSNLQIPEAFILPFDQTVPRMFTIGKKQYAGIQFYYIVFPYKSGRFTVPPFPIQVTGPPEGSAVSQKWKLRTREIPFTVKAVPASVQAGDWLVAKNVFVSESWNKSLTHLKVGDVLERTDLIDARGTLPQFIPPFPLDSIDWASEYPRDPVLRDERNDEDVNGSRTQKTIYLLEKAGDFIVPALNVRWWNPRQERMFSKPTRPIRIHIYDNKNLGILKTLTDSLSAKPQQSNAEVNAGGKKMLGLPWYLFSMFLLDGLLCLIVVFILSNHITDIIRKKMIDYRSSEKYWFTQFIKSKNGPRLVLDQFYAWWDRWRGDNTSPSVSSNKNLASLTAQLKMMEQNVYSGSVGHPDPKTFKYQVAQFRKEAGRLTIQKVTDQVQDIWPVKLK
jgi:hypothetical protein